MIGSSRARWWALLGLFGLAACAADTRDSVSHANLPDLPNPPFPTTPAGVALGRRLFYDVQLSGDDRISCAACHDPARAFTDGVARTSIGATGVTLERNSPGLANVAWAPALFWDGGSKNLESFVLAPITNPDEMAQSLPDLMVELGSDPTYVDAFEAAYPSDGLVIANVMRALAEYMRTLISSGSRYDRYVRGEGGRLSADELAGREVYEMHCARCHASDLFTDEGYHNNGLDTSFPVALDALGRGRARITADDADLGKYRTPSLRNLSYTAPYMHDGRLATLDDVIAHYRTGVQSSPSLDPGLVGVGGELGIPLTDEEASNLVAFLRTLDDPGFVARAIADAP